MSGHPSTLTKHRTAALMLGAVLFTLTLIVAFRGPTPPPENVTIRVVSVSPRATGYPPVHPAFDAAAFHATIIDNNLFRPLGWTPPAPVEPYRLLGTSIPTDGLAPPHALLENTAGKKTYHVTIDEKLDTHTTIVAIHPKQVTLDTNGKQRTLSLDTNVWLNAKRPAPRHRQDYRTAATTPPAARTQKKVTRSPLPRATDQMRPSTRRAIESGQPPSGWRTRDGEVILIGDARLKNPQKWELIRR